MATFSSASSASNSAREVLGKSYTPHSLQLIEGEALERLNQMGLPQNDRVAVVAAFAGRKASVERQVEEATQLMKHT